MSDSGSMVGRVEFGGGDGVRSTQVSVESSDAVTFCRFEGVNSGVADRAGRGAVVGMYRFCDRFATGSRIFSDTEDVSEDILIPLPHLRRKEYRRGAGSSSTPHATRLADAVVSGGEDPSAEMFIQWTIPVCDYDSLTEIEPSNCQIWACLAWKVFRTCREMYHSENEGWPYYDF